MYKKLFTFVLGCVFTFVFNLNAYSAENTNPVKIAVAENELDYQGFNSPLTQKYRQELMDKMVQSDKAMVLSGLYFGLGQIYSGEINKGAWILAGGTALVVSLFGFVLPRLSNRQEGVTSLGSGLCYILLGVAYAWNVKDAFDTAEQVNSDIKEKLLLSEKIIEQADKISLKTSNETVSLNYQIKF